MDSGRSEPVSVGREHSELVVSEGKYSFLYGDHRIQFLRIAPKRKDQKQKVTVHVTPDGFIEVVAPETLEKAELIAMVRKKASWILDQLKSSEREGGAMDSAYSGGSSHRYLGKQYVLKVNVHKTEAETVRLVGGQFEVVANYRDPHRVRNVLNRWYERKANDVFERRLDRCLKRTPWVKTKPHIKLQWMKKQWGNCTPSGNLTLNVQLVKAPNQCIEYVLYHELCHIAERNHSDRFYRLLDDLMPEWKTVKARLDDLADRNT